MYSAEETDAPKSPGMKHRHYSPKARVVLSRESGVASPRPQVPSPKLNAAFIGLSPFDGDFELFKICDSVENYAHSLFEFFRECDRRGIDTIYCESVEETGIGAALMDRLRRAAE
jgi:L-threonylcarbamoyladenylate synthase